MHIGSLSMDFGDVGKDSVLSFMISFPWDFSSPIHLETYEVGIERKAKYYIAAKFTEVFDK